MLVLFVGLSMLLVGGCALLAHNTSGETAMPPMVLAAGGIIKPQLSADTRPHAREWFDLRGRPRVGVELLLDLAARGECVAVAGRR